MFCKKGVLRNFAKFTGKHLCQSLFFNNVEALRPATLLKKRLWHRCFPVNCAKFLRTPFFIEHLWWLLVNSLMKNSYKSNCEFQRFVGFRKLSQNSVLLSKCSGMYFGKSFKVARTYLKT